MTGHKPGKQRFLLWGDYVYELAGHRNDVDDFKAGREGSGYLAAKTLTFQGKVYEEGEELPRGPRFPRNTLKGRLDISVAFPLRPDFEAMLERGDVKRRRGRPKRL